MTAPVIEAPVAADPSPSPVRGFSDDVRTHTRVLAGLIEYALQDSAEVPVLDAVFDDLESVLGEHADLTASEITKLTPRLHSAFRRMVGIAVQSNGGVGPDTIERTRTLLAERSPEDFLPARAYLRRLAIAVEDLLDQLLEDMP
ncbi:DUF6415 family natural product biosynthesis protein [Streptomyces sp. NPDC002668]|uniref:DUF6415 family natural product biosynthesis protein n=1 Tax=Streptomyces sp. NPDC002668 TaxID=3154422 RepID=UPI00331E9A81